MILSKKKRLAIYANLLILVELSGIEPLTS